jgi:hypothetical protein
MHAINPLIGRERITCPFQATDIYHCFQDNGSWIAITLTKSSKMESGRAMAQAVSRRPPTAEARVQSRVSPCGICGGQSGSGTGFSPSTSVFPCQFHSTGVPLLGKMKKTDHLSLHLHHKVAQ